MAMHAADEKNRLIRALGEMAGLTGESSNQLFEHGLAAAFRMVWSQPSFFSNG
jgi:hypothetical protein